MRATFHKERFGEQLGKRTVTYQETLSTVKQSLLSEQGLTPDLAQQMAKGEVSKIISNQASLAGFNDGFLILGAAIFIVTIVVAICMIYVKVTGGQINIHED